MKNITRRQVLTVSAGAFVAVPLLGLRRALAAEAEKLDPADPQAQALQYVHESEKEGQQCRNCQLYTGEADAEWGPCGIFPGKQVSANGWCVSWVEKTG